MPSRHHSRHVSRRDLKIREFVAQNRIKVTYVPTTENQADLMTKHLRSDVFWRHAYTVLGKRVDASNTIDICGRVALRARAWLCVVLTAQAHAHTRY